MNISEEPMVSNKADFTISIENGAIQITDRNGKRGGSVSSASGRKLSWRNETGGTCTLEFLKLLDESDPASDPKAWPFTPDQNPWSNAVSLPIAPTPNQNPWEGKLATVRAVTSYEYKVHVEMPDGRKYHLDPIIIVR